LSVFPNRLDGENMSRKSSSNRLANESSPYLLQHAENPVDWYPWGDEAFAEALRLKKPILLSIGYSACHWCHVMAHESFENEDIAGIMNTHFINIKVDREERPDLDQIYQNAVQLFIRRGGGWPLTMFLTPEKMPFYGGTYFPPKDRYQLPGFPKVLQAMSEAYRERPDDISRTVQDVQKALHRSGKKKSLSVKKELNPDLLKDAIEKLQSVFDADFGGFGAAPKFPGTPSLDLFLRYFHHSGDDSILKKVTFTLRQMAQGGVYDQLGGGFHRYSVDAQWQVPHFEKMLYDNAQLARLYFRTFQASGERFFQDIGIEILEYVLREMTDSEGGFYSAQDADSEGTEGTYFIWRPREVHSILGTDSGTVFCSYYNITDTGNFEGQNIPHLTRSIEVLAEELGRPVDEIINIIQTSKAKLLQYRENRIKPERDDKILTNWNSLMIGAFVTGYQVSGEIRFLSAAEKAAGFILSHLYQNSRLLHTYKDGIAKLNAYLDDVAYFLDALIDLYEVSGKQHYLSQAKSFADILISKFWDHEAGAFYFTSNDHEKLIDRTQPVYDQSVPSGNAIAAQALQRLFCLSGEKTYQERAESILIAFGSEMKGNCFGTGNMIAAADLFLRTAKEIHIIGDLNTKKTKTLLAKINQLYLPNKVLSFGGEGLSAKPSWRDQNRIAGKTSVSICQNFTCSSPLTEWKEIRDKLLEVS